MKKLINLLLVLCLLTGFVACGEAGASDKGRTTDMASESTESSTESDGESVNKTEIVAEADYTAFGVPNRAEGSTLRMIVNNLRTQTLTPDVNRGTLFYTAVDYYNADILALQETDEGWYKDTKLGCALEKKLGDKGYAIVPLVSGSGEWSSLKNMNNRNAIFYRIATVKLIECGYDRYEVTKNMSPARPDCAYTWALFEEIATAKRFTVISTHLISGSESQKRLDSAIELSEFVKELEDKYDAPVMAVGDYNSTANTQVGAKMISAGLVSAVNVANSRKNTNYSTTNEIGSPPKNGNPIDHCFITRNAFDIHHFEVLICPSSYAYSDHVPLLMDFSIK